MTSAATTIGHAIARAEKDGMRISGEGTMPLLTAPFAGRGQTERNAG